MANKYMHTNIHAIYASILSHLAEFDSSMSLHKYYLVSTTFFGQQLDDEQTCAS